MDKKRLLKIAKRVASKEVNSVNYDSAFGYSDRLGKANLFMSGTAGSLGWLSRDALDKYKKDDLTTEYIDKNKKTIKYFIKQFESGIKILKDISSKYK